MHPVRLSLLVGLVLLAGCQHVFKPAEFQSSEALYRATMREYERRKWDNAVLGFERLTIDLPARDTLLPLAHYYLAKSHAKRREWLLAAQSFTRLTENFPDHALADDALLEAGKAYDRMWRKPALDAQYGQTAMSTYQTFLGMYPNSPLRPEADRSLNRLDEMFARKDFETGMHYYRRKAYDPAIIYFKDVIRLHPNTATAREAYLRLVSAYRKIRYTDEANEVCEALRRTYPDDREVREACGAVDSATAAKPAP
jgi:outer membrane protein assembly factor BamD